MKKQETENKPPATIDEAVDRLINGLADALSEKDSSKIAKMDDEDLVLLHHTLGRWIRNNFGLWGRNHPELMDDCISRGCSSGHPDDASMMIMTALRDRLAKRAI